MTGNRPSPILEAGVVAAAGPLLVFSLYLLFAGHNQPGGGFAGGLVAGIAILLVWVAGGTATVRRVLPVRSTVLMGIGLTVAAIVGLIPLVAGLQVLESGYVEVAIPLLGTVKLVSAFFFDVGVYFSVVGMALALIRVLGEDSTLASGGDE